MIEYADKKKAVNIRPYAHRIGEPVRCGTKDCDKRATHMCVTPGKFTSRKDENGNRVPGVFKPSKFDQSDWDRFEDAIRELKAARAAAEDAAKQAEADERRANELANEVFNSL